MDYQKLYIDLMETRYNRILDEDVYIEEHHIVPRCLGGLDSKDNIIKLTAKEHYVAHHLLCKIFKDLYSLLFAFTLMNARVLVNENFSFITARMYEKSRELYSIANSLLLKKLWNTKEFKDKHLKVRSTGKYKENHSKSLAKAHNIYKENYERGSLKQRKVYEIETHTGQIYLIRGIGKFQKLNGLYNLSSVAMGKREHCLGLKVREILNWSEHPLSKEIKDDLILDKKELLSKEESLNRRIDKVWNTRKRNLNTKREEK